MTDPEMEHHLMTDEPRTAVHLDEPFDDRFADDAGDDLYAEPLPPRRRRRLLTPATGVLAAVTLVAGGFIGGVQVQKHQGGTSSGGAGLPAGFAARFGQGGGQAGASGSAAGAAPTTGTVANVNGNTLYVTGSDGTTVKVKVGANAKVTRTASSSAAAVHPGDTVVVQGTKAASGTVTATSVTASAKGVSGAGAGGFGAASGAQGNGGRAAGAPAGLPPGFTPPGG